MMTKKIQLSIAFACVVAGLFAQVSTQEKARYYIHVNQLTPGAVYQIFDNQLHLEYDDAYGASKKFALRIYDWQHELITTLQLDKDFGLNNYTVKLEDVHSGWQLNKVYTGEFKNEEGTLYKIPFVLVASEKKNPEIGIVVNPVTISCDDLSQSLVEFYGDIQGGKAPYTVNWFVLNNSRTDLLYQPKEEIIQFPGKTSMIRVDKNPEYYVALFVKDACGEEQRKIVNMTCGSENKKINTIFVEELTGPLLLKPIK